MMGYVYRVISSKLESKTFSAPESIGIYWNALGCIVKILDCCGMIWNDVENTGVNLKLVYRGNISNIINYYLLILVYGYFLVRVLLIATFFLENIVLIYHTFWHFFFLSYLFSILPGVGSRLTRWPLGGLCWFWALYFCDYF